MKKIILLFVIFISFAAQAQEPSWTYKPRLFQPGNWYMIGTWDSVSASYKDTLGYYLEGDTVHIWSNKVLNINGQTILPDYWKLTDDKLEPKTATNYINTDSSYYLKGVDFIRYDTVLYNQSIGENALKNSTTGNFNTAYGYYSLFSNMIGNSNTAYGSSSLQNTEGNFNTGIGSLSLYNNTADSNNIAIGYSAGYSAQMSNRLWIGQGDSNSAIIYGEMLTRPRIRINGELFATNLLVNQSATIGTNLTVHGEIINGGLINKDTVITIADSTSPFAFPTSSTGWAEIYIDSLGYIVSFANAYWGIDGAVILINKGTNVVTTNTDDKHCIFDEGSYCALINRRASSYKYMIKFHYNN